MLALCDRRMRGDRDKVFDEVYGKGKMRLALLQMRVLPGEPDRNLKRAAELVRAAKEKGAELVLLPEALPFGWMDSSAREFAEAIPGGRYYDELEWLARGHGVYLCSGLAEWNQDRLFNAAVLISNTGELLLHHRKIHELRIAHDCYALGDRLGVVDTDLGRIGLIICADAFASGQVITRSLCLMGAQLILSPCAWAVPPDHDNARTPYGKLWRDNYGVVAREFGVWIAGCSNVGPIQSGPWAGHKCIGCSMVVGPTGKVEVQGPYGEDAEEIVMLDLALEAVRRTSAD
jgi:predicted amidohydrolase